MHTILIHYLTLSDGYATSTVTLPYHDTPRPDGTVRCETANGLTRWAHVDDPCLVCKQPVSVHLDK